MHIPQDHENGLASYAFCSHVHSTAKNQPELYRALVNSGNASRQPHMYDLSSGVHKDSSGHPKATPKGHRLDKLRKKPPLVCDNDYESYPRPINHNS